MGVPLKWLVYVRENPMKMHDLGVPPFMETAIYSIVRKQFCIYTYKFM